MFQVMIIDDEPSVAQALLVSVDWTALGLEVAGIASNGEDGLRLAEEKPIDIAILDIRMPGISGLELCELLKVRKNQIQVIVISGYAEFAYAERAIRCGVVGYCLKPLDYAQVTRCLLKAIQNLKPEQESKTADALLELLENGAEANIVEVLRGQGLKSQEYGVAVLTETERVFNAGMPQIALHLGRGVWGYLLNASDLRGWIELYKKTVISTREKRWHGGCGYTPDALRAQALYQALKCCRACAYQFFVNGTQFCTKLDENRASVWLENLRGEQDINRICALLEQIDRCGQEDFTIKNALKLHNSLSILPDFSENEQYAYSDGVDQLVAEYGSFHNMLQKLLSLPQKAKKSAQEQKNFSNASFMKALLYVDSHYRETITLTGVAEVLSMSPNYVSQLFKRETGFTFVQYVTQKRLADAEQMLRSSERSVTDIAASVGFNDYFYFMKIFKKNTGLTPRQYRKGEGIDMDNPMISS